MKSFLTLLFVLGSYLSHSQTSVTAMEYFIDDDPGVGNATSVDISAGTTFNESFTIASSGGDLTEGFHVLVIRVQDASNRWSMLEAKTFYVSPSDPINTSQISAGEYFLDTDPGYGEGTAFSVTAGVNIDDSFTILSSGGDLTEGFHNLVIRLQDENSVWGMQESKVFFVVNSDPISTSTVVAAEYYVDSDPGFGMANSITLTSGTDVDFNFTITSAELGAGFHNIVIRTQDDGGVWSMQESKAIYVTNADPISTAQVVNAEYFIDSDPGIGNANAITLTSGTAVDFGFTIPNASLTAGFHSIVIRLEDENGQWSVLEQKAIYVSDTDPLSATMVTALEYFFDQSDPGVGAATAIDIVDVSSFDLETVIATSGLGAGMHAINFRAQDERGVWSMIESRNFFVDQMISAPLDEPVPSNVASIEYFVNTDPGLGNGTVLNLDPATPMVDEDFTVVTSDLEEGTHYLGVRLINELGIYSQTEIIEMTVCNGAVVSFTADNLCLGDETMFTDTSTEVLVDDVYSWDFDGDGNEDDATVGDPTFTYPSAGTYTASLTISNELCTATGTLEVTIHDLPTTVMANSTAGAVCEGEEVTLTGSGVVSYVWDNGITDGVAFVPASTATYTVTGTDANGCSNTDQIEVVVNSLPTVAANVDDDSICPGDEVVLTGSGASTYIWDNGVSDGVAIVPSATTNYTVTGTDSNGCENTAMIEVVVNELPVVQANTSSENVCDGSEVTLTGSGADTYVWDHSVVDGVSFVPVETATYTVTGTDSNGCENTDQVVVTLLDLPVVSASTSDEAVCSGDEVTLTGSGALSYSWDNGVSDGVAFVPTGTMTYTVTGADVNGCENTDNIAVTVNALPEVIASASDDNICLGDEVVLTGGGALSFTWDNGVTDGIGTVPDATTTYTVTGSDINGCTNTDMIEVVVNALPDVVANASSLNLCNGAEVTLTGSGASSYVWDNEVVDGVSFVPLETVVYTVEGTDSNGCSNTDEIEVTVDILAAPSISLVEDNGVDIILMSSSETGNQWFEGGTLLEGQVDQTLRVRRSSSFGGDYQVQYTEGSCTSALSEVYSPGVLSASDLSTEIKLWPNPSDDRITLEGIDGSAQFNQVTILDYAGVIVKVLKPSLDGGNMEIDVSDIESGAYLIHIESKNGYLKFIKR